MVGLAVGLTLAGCAGGAGPSHPPRDRPAATARLVTYHDCDDLLKGLREATAARVGPHGLPGDGLMRPLAGGHLPRKRAKAAAPAPAPSHSTTNVASPGADEPDLVKTDGRRIVTVADGELQVVDAAAHRVTGTLDLGDHGFSPGRLLLHGDRVLVLMRPPMLARPTVGFVPSTRHARLVIADISGKPRTVSTMTVDGSYVDARLTGSLARVVVRSTPDIEFPPRRRDTSDAEATAANRRVVRKAPLSAWLPDYTVTRGDRTHRRTVPCGRVEHPASYAGTSMLSVLSVDLTGDMRDVDPIGVVADGDTVYATATSLYVTDRDVRDTTSTPRAGGSDDRRVRTRVHKFDIRGGGRPRYVASGTVPGDTLDQYAMSELGGRLRVATTTGRGDTAESSVYVLARRGGRLVTVGSVGGLGKGERIRAVRFIGTVGYVVTFRRVDPLYTVDLSDPEHPRVAGELTMTGYSAYLHPVGDDRLLGVGRQADAHGRTLGVQVSLFDVTDPAKPRRLAAYRLAGGSSSVEFDPHAFLYRPRSGLTVIPVTGPDRRDGEALVLSVRGNGVRRLGTLHQHKGGRIERTVLIGDTLWTLSRTGLQANSATTLTETAWVPFAS